MEENQITKQYSTMTLENLFKHNIFFTPVNEDRTSYISWLVGWLYWGLTPL